MAVVCRAGRWRKRNVVKMLEDVLSVMLTDWLARRSHDAPAARSQILGRGQSC